MTESTKKEYPPGQAIAVVLTMCAVIGIGLYGILNECERRGAADERRAVYQSAVDAGAGEWVVDQETARVSFRWRADTPINKEVEDDE